MMCDMLASSEWLAEWKEWFLSFDWSTMTPFLYMLMAVAAGMLVWNTVEVGRNDAANIVNAVFGARILPRRRAVWLAGLGAVLGAALSSEVVETARKGIFEPSALTLRQALCVYASVYIVNTVLLYGYSAFGMPVSTTACLVCGLLGAGFSLGFFRVVYWGEAGTVFLAIICSIFIAGIAGWLIQRVMRGAIRDQCQDLQTLLLHGGWAGGGMLAGLTYFMLTKGMGGLDAVGELRLALVRSFGPSVFFVVVLLLWAVYALIIHFILVTYREKAARLLFPVLAVVGMMCMGFAFGQNDLANCASPGLSAINLIQHRAQGVAAATKVDIPRWMLFGCGFLLLAGMQTRNAQRVTRAEVNTGSMTDTVALWAPRWCIAVARMMLRLRPRGPVLAPPPAVTASGKRLHYDALRACVILSISASVIATASSFGWPVSTTYVAFAAVIATGAADRILQRGDAELKLGRTIWVIFSWFASAVIAAVATGCVCRLVFHLGWLGVLIGVGINLIVRRHLKKQADAQEERVREAARERRNPEYYAEPEDI